MDYFGGEGEDFWDCIFVSLVPFPVASFSVTSVWVASSGETSASLMFISVMLISRKLRTRTFGLGFSGPVALISDAFGMVVVFK